MNILESKIADLKCRIDTYLLSKGITTFSYGLVRFANTKEFNKLQTVNFEENGNRVTFDDSYDCSFYFKSSKEYFSEERSGGKANKYLISASIDMFVMSKYGNTKDIIIAFLTENGSFKINEIDNNSDSINRSELGSHGYELSQSLYSIKFDLKYRSNECTVKC